MAFLLISFARKKTLYSLSSTPIDRCECVVQCTPDQRTNKYIFHFRRSVVGTEIFWKKEKRGEPSPSNFHFESIARHLFCEFIVTNYVGVRLGDVCSQHIFCSHRVSAISFHLSEPIHTHTHIAIGQRPVINLRDLEEEKKTISSFVAISIVAVHHIIAVNCKVNLVRSTTRQTNCQPQLTILFSQR